VNKKIKLCIICSLSFVVLIVLTVAAIAETSGQCGKKLTWSLSDDGVLTISGTGDMYSYNLSKISPFYYNSSIKEVILTEGISSIGSYAFSGCSGLINVVISNSVISIERDAFSGCSDLTTIIIPPSVARIDNKAFMYCRSLTSINVEENNQYYVSDSGLLYNKDKSILNVCPCGKSGEVVIPDSVTTIMEYAFFGCSDLTNVMIPNSVSSIGDAAFAGCSGLTNVTIPNCVTSIKDTVFSGCSELTSILIPNGVISIENNAFEYCSSLTSITIPDSVTSIGNYAFCHCSSLTSVTIPDSVTTIGQYTFSDCEKLTDITLSDYTTSIKSNTFFNCSNLTNITIPNSVISIDNNAFSGCSGIKSLTIPNSVIRIGSGAFSGCSGLTSITIPDSVTSIAEAPFQNCTALKSITLGASIPIISKGILTDCNPNNVSIRGGVIGANAFSGNSSITNLELGNAVTSIGNEAFRNCINITSISIPDSVINIERNAFSGCSGLTSVYMSNGVTSIGDYAFSGCIGLERLVIPTSVTSIGIGAFDDCASISSVTIPESVTVINDYAFRGNFNLAKVCIQGFEVTLGKWVFPSTATIYCYEYSDVDAYSADYGYNVMYLDSLDLNTIRSVTLFGGTYLANGDVTTLQVDVFPASSVNITWKSSNSSVVSVSDGIITAHKDGSAMITAIAGSASDSLLVTVYTPATAFTIEEEAWVVAKEPYQVTLKSVTPTNGVLRRWDSSDKSTATVDAEGNVTSKKVGDVTITGTADNGVSHTCLIHFCLPVMSMTFKEAGVSLAMGHTKELNLEVTTNAGTYTNRLAAFSSSAPAVAIVDNNGLVTAVSTGSATITATAANGVSATCTVKVVAGNILVLPSGLAQIDSEAFAGLSKVDGIRIPSTVKTIADDAFSGSDVAIFAPKGSTAATWGKTHGFTVIEE